MINVGDEFTQSRERDYSRWRGGGALGVVLNGLAVRQKYKKERSRAAGGL